jgi:hypothetical protein
MAINILDKKEITSSESTDYSIGITKQNWQTPKIMELDYASTENSGGLASDGGIGS